MNTINVAVSERTMKKPTLKKIVSLIVLLGFVAFAILAYLGISPLTALNFVSVPVLGSISPNFIFAIYGEDATTKLNNPMGLEIVDNRIYVSDTGNDRIAVFDKATGRPLFQFGKPGSGSGQLSYPYGLAADGNDLYVADMHNGRVVVYDLNGKFKSYFAKDAKIQVPTNVFVDGDKVYITDVGTHSVKVFNKQGKSLMTIGGVKGSEKGQLIYPNSVFVQNDNIYVADTGNNRVQVFDLNGKFVKYLTGQPQQDENRSTTTVNPRGIAMDPKGVIYVVSPILNMVTGIDELEGNQLFTFGSTGTENDQFYVANDLAIDDQGRIYIADKGNNRVCVYGF